MKILLKIGLIFVLLLNTTLASKLDVCFTPPSGCSEKIIEEINNSKASIYVQAYGFTSKKIADSLINAHLRGVKVQVILDRSNMSKKGYSKLMDLKEAGIDISLDIVPGIAHNKVMIIDEKKVITGSFNFTEAADKRNSENVIIIEDKETVKQYLNNWYNRKK
ncbi:MAG TPA: phospholipase D family protein [Methanofastidiosum sp.]|nr:phospholipase D family protein [Methanofastidiosum sp.]